MADLSLAKSGYATGATDTWTSQVANVSLYKAQHVNGLASAILQIEAALGSGSSLPGSLSTLAARLAVQVGSDGIIIPVGAGMDYYGASAPNGWLFCDGSAVSRVTYSALYTALGGASSPYGQGNGTTTFNLPDKRHRVSMGAGAGARDTESGTGVISGGTALSAKTPGQWGGSSAVSLTAANNGPHTHTFAVATDSSGGGTTIARDVDNTPLGSYTTDSQGSGTAHENEMCYLVCNAIIKY